MKLKVLSVLFCVMVALAVFGNSENMPEEVEPPEESTPLAMNSLFLDIGPTLT